MERFFMQIRNVRIVLPDRVIERGCLEVEGRRIGRIHESLATTGGLDGNGLTVIPGIVDLHGDMLEREIEPRPRAHFPIPVAMHELDKRLAAAGITTAYAAVGFAWYADDLRTQETAVQIIRTLNTMRHTLLTDCRIHARFEINNPETVPVLRQMLIEDQVDLVSVMDHNPGQGQYSDATRYTRFLKDWLGFTDDQLAPVYERMEAKIAELKRVPRDWSLTRAIVETACAYNVIVASHDDDTVDKVEQQAEMGVTISEFPINAAAAQAARERGMHIVMGAPNAFRGESNTGNLSARQAVQAGIVDVLATDYVPGAMLHAAWQFARNGILDLPAAIRLITANPATAVRLHDRGRVETGLLADLVFVEDGDLPRVRATMRNGQFIYCDSAGYQMWAMSAEHAADMQ
jgi:alpha-D-ribose 1-methylphosphonate 5-triphosphate diphosphatase